MKPDIAVALDLPTAAEALRVVDAVGAAGSWYKVGPVLFVSDGPHLITELLRRDKRVFLDLKWHDIPSTVAGAVGAAARLGVHLATVHVAGGAAMLAAAVAARAGPLKLAGVGVLTSLGGAELGSVLGRPVGDIGEEQRRFARIAADAGLDAMVCAVADAAAVRAVVGAARMLVVPGIRRPGDPAGDQVRTATPAAAVRAGADLLVVGRAVTGAADPAAVLAELRMALAA